MKNLTLLLITCLVTSISSCFGQADQKLAKEIFKELIEINTTNSVGDNTKAAEAMAKRLRVAGFSDSDIFVGGPVERKGNLVATLRGSGKAKPVLCLAHIDVVEALPEDWSFDPFTFKELDGYFYGRGTSDDKAMAAIFIANLIRLKQEKYVPDGNIIVALTSDEEGGDFNGVDWLLKNHKDLIDSELALNEGGRGQKKDGKKIANSVQLGEKVYQSFSLEVKNRGGHSSMPRKDNAIYQLTHSLENISKYEFPINLNDGTRAFFELSSKIETGQLSSDMKNIITASPDKEVVARFSEMPMYNALLRTTCVATQLKGGHAENALPQTATAVINCRILPGEDPQKIKEKLISLVDNPEISVTAVRPSKPSQPSPLSPRVFGPIRSITEQMWPGIPVIPTMSTGATDGLYLRNAGIPTYGVSGIFSDINDVRAHGRDERIEIESFYEGQEFLYRLVKELTSKKLASLPSKKK